MSGHPRKNNLPKLINVMINLKTKNFLRRGAFFYHAPMQQAVHRAVLSMVKDWETLYWMTSSVSGQSRPSLTAPTMVSIHTIVPTLKMLEPCVFVSVKLSPDCLRA